MTVSARPHSLESRLSIINFRLLELGSLSPGIDFRSSGRRTGVSDPSYTQVTSMVERLALKTLDRSAGPEPSQAR